LPSIQYNTKKFLTPHNVCQLAESEARAVAGGKWESVVKKLKNCSKIKCFKINFKTILYHETWNDLVG